MNGFEQIPVVALKTLTHCVTVIVMNTDAVGWTRSTRNNSTGGLSQIRTKWATCRPCHACLKYDFDNHDSSSTKQQLKVIQLVKAI